MFTRLVAGALFAGLSAGALGALVQINFVVPLIHEAELYETGALTHITVPQSHDHSATAPVVDDAVHDHAPGTPAVDDHPGEVESGGDAGASLSDPVVAPPFDLQRSAVTFGMALITYTGFALLLVAGFALAERAGHAVTARRGAIWGLAGFLAVQLAPAFGLPPEVPGAVAAALVDRQVWWIATVLATATGLALLAFGRHPLAIGGAIVVIALPHLIGAPTAPYGGVVPPELAAHFVARSLGAGALCWTLLGTIAGAFWARGR